MRDSLRAGACLKRASLVFWDFDGVIKESLEVKSIAFERLFLPYGTDVAARVRAHHEAHGGVSRFEKMPVYLEWAGESATQDRVQEFCARFGDAVRQAVIDAPWVEGVEPYLRSNHARQCFVLVSATPQQEIEAIARALQLTTCFERIYGAPTSKADAIRKELAARSQPLESCVMVGDSDTDLSAASVNGIPFILRRTSHNRNLQARHGGASFEILA